MESDPSIIGYIVGGLGVLMGGGGVAAYRKAGSENTNLHVDTADHLVEMVRSEMVEIREHLSDERNARTAMEATLQRRISDQSDQIRSLRKELDIQRLEVRRLRKKLVEAGINPDGNGI